MSLPKIDIPVYETQLPLTGLKVTYRPLLVKEEKIILMATQSGDEKEIQKSIEQILTNVVQTKVNLSELPLADVEWLIIQVRDKSLGGTQTLEYTCNAVSETMSGPSVCNHRFKAVLDFNKLETVYGGEHTQIANDKIQVTKDVGIKLKPPSFGVLRDLEKPDAEYDYDVLVNVIDFVYDKDQTYKLNEQPKKEVTEFLDSLSKSHMDQITDYILSMPRYEINVGHTCEKCGHEHKIKVTDLASFFQ